MTRIALALSFFFASISCYANYPAKPVRIVVGFSAGSASDILARALGTELSKRLNQTFIIENKPGAGSMIAAQTVANAVPDGYTLLVVSAAHAASPSLYKSMPYDTFQDFVGVSRLANVPSVLIVNPSIGVSSVSDLVALGKSKPRSLNFSSPGTGSANHLASELLLSKAGFEGQHVPYKGIPEALTAVASGDVQFAFLPIMNVLGLVNQGKVTALAVSTMEQSQIMPNVESVSHAGINGYQFDPWFGLLAPAKVTKETLEIIAKATENALNSLAMKEKLLHVGAEAAPLTLGKFDEFIKLESIKFNEIVVKAGIKPE